VLSEVLYANKIKMEKLVSLIKQNPRIKNFVFYLISSKRNSRPRFWVKLFINPFVHRRGKGAVIRPCRSRIDVFPWHKFEVGKNAVIEDLTRINNSAGDVFLGNGSRIGASSVVIGPVIIKSGVELGQHVFVSGFNSIYEDGTRNYFEPDLERKPTVIDEETHIGSNSVIVPGIHIGKRCQIGAGSIVTEDIPDYSIAFGNPARVYKRYSFEKDEWIKDMTESL
jgi:acetyltransferase-like isoleucine patch superfamily enzyme